MDHINTLPILAILAGLLLGVLGGIAYARWSRDNHYLQGWTDAATGHRADLRDSQKHIHALQSDISHLHQGVEAMREAHHLDREGLILDADRRIAAYSRRANPLDQTDAAGLRLIVKTLQLAERTWNAMPGAAGPTGAARLDILLVQSIATKVERALVAAGQAEIQPAAVERNAAGYWDHPHLPAFEPEDTDGEMLDWLQEQRLQTAYDTFDSWAPENHPYYATGAASISDWQPTPPAGEGWFLLSIYETEDNGPVAMFAQRTTPIELEAAA